jgi:hypothetical protein
MANRVEFIGDVEERIREAGLDVLMARRAECHVVGHQWQPLQTRVIPGGVATYCRHCLGVNRSGSIDWPVKPPRKGDSGPTK